jgi:hypothetical protein
MNNLTLDKGAFSYTDVAKNAKKKRATKKTEETVGDVAVKPQLDVSEQINLANKIKTDIAKMRELQPMVELSNISVSVDEILIDLKKIKNKYRVDD